MYVKLEKSSYLFILGATTVMKIKIAAQDRLRKPMMKPSTTNWLPDCG